MEGDGTILADRAVVAPPPGPRPTRLDRVVAWILIGAVVGILGCAIVLGERETTVADLRRGIAAGDVSEVWLSEELPADARGRMTVGVRWEDHGLTYVASLTQASGEVQARQARRENDLPVVVGDVASALTTNGNAVTVVGHRDRFPGASTTEIAGFTSPGWLIGVWLGVVCATLLLIGAIEPWRATRWGWAWLVLLTPIGVPLFLLFGGILGFVPPRPGQRRLTGGWSFLLASAIGAALR